MPKHEPTFHRFCLAKHPDPIQCLFYKTLKHGYSEFFEDKCRYHGLHRITCEDCIERPVPRQASKKVFWDKGQKGLIRPPRGKRFRKTEIQKSEENDDAHRERSLGAGVED